MKNDKKITKLHTVQSLSILFLMKLIDILESMMERNIWLYFIQMKNMKKLLTEEDILLD